MKYSEFQDAKQTAEKQVHWKIPREWSNAGLT